MSISYQLDKVGGPVSLKDKAYTAIKDAILSVKLKPGTPLVETQLAEELGISKTPVRAALEELEREGFVTRILFKGTYVTEVTVKDLVEIFQLRAVLEGLAARIATPLFSPRELDRIAHKLTAAETALAQGDLALCSELGKSLHDVIIDKADSQRLTLIIRNLDDHVQRFRAISDQISGRLNKSVKEHRRILDALRRRDSDAAAQAMRDHLHSVLQDLFLPDE
jgi:DNA-binding GntR family transcriptional regulator